MRNRWIPITVLTIGAVGLLAGLISIAIGEENPRLILVEGAGEVQELIGGIRQLDRRLGDDDAAVSLTLFTDVQCPRCADYQAEVIDPVIAEDVRPGGAKINFRNFPLGPKPVTVGAIAVAAAQQQDRGWQYLELFMRNLDQVPERGVNQQYLDEIAAATPKLDTGAWEEALLGEQAAQDADDDEALATELRLPADPAVVVDGARGSETLEEAPTLDELRAAMDRVR